MGGVQLIIAVGGQPSDYPNPVVELDGLTPVDLIVDATIDSDKDYSFSMMVRPTVDTGALLHYKPNDSTQQLKELTLYISGGYIHMERILTTESEISPPSTQQIPINTWHFITFGINISNGKMIININGDNIEHDNNYIDNVDFIIPGILRVGGMFDQRKPILQGRVACVGFYGDVKEPEQRDSEPSCKAGNWVNKSRFGIVKAQRRAVPAIDTRIEAKEDESIQPGKQIPELRYDANE
ncbi:unnamed protein product [Mytilus coruscus]|uniref:Laminin G domain-containing protein n=1 Tax=Mytilus coruscus TaxID=42192 RepID=A0A6J8CFZ0_MYTCO|nr:unnamed protein product [Mytilus coruscus]